MATDIIFRCWSAPHSRTAVAVARRWGFYGFDARGDCSRISERMYRQSAVIDLKSLIILYFVFIGIKL